MKNKKVMKIENLVADYVTKNRLMIGWNSVQPRITIPKYWVFKLAMPMYIKHIHYNDHIEDRGKDPTKVIDCKN